MPVLFHRLFASPVDLPSRIRLFAVHQILTFVRFHMQCGVDSQKDPMEERRSWRQRIVFERSMQKLVILKDTCWELLLKANRGMLVESDTGVIAELEKEVNTIIYEFHLDNNRHMKYIITQDHHCLSVPSLFNSRGLDDSLIVQSVSPKSDALENSRSWIQRCYSEKDVTKLKRRSSIADLGA